jgi:L-threonylcarbamoyladenylate synthase
MQELILSKALSALSKGQVIVYPTDTLYGLGADIYNKDAVKNVFKIKNRPFNFPISVAVSCIEDLEKIAYVNNKIKKIIDHFLPGKLTIILKKKKTIPSIVTSNKDNIAIRIPDNNIALELLSNFGPLTCTSANIHGKPTPTVINDIQMQFKDSNISVYIDNGKLQSKASTIIDLTFDKPIIIREGAITKKEIMDMI